MHLAKTLGVPPVKDTLRLFAERIAYVKETIFGQLFDVIAEPEDVASHFAYTSQALDLHTDLNYREKSPGFQMLHCLESKGPPDQGTSHFADGFAAAGWLRENHPSAFHILTSLPVNFTLRTYGVSADNSNRLSCDFFYIEKVLLPCANHMHRPLWQCRRDSRK